MSQKGDVLEARQCFTDAERSFDRTKAVELYTKAARHYLNAARAVEDDALKRSLIYLSNCCSQKAVKRAAAGWKPPVMRSVDDLQCHADTMESHRLLHIAHLQRLKGVEKIPRRSESTAFQVVKDMLVLESALASIGFKNPKAIEKTAPPENMLRSTFAFTSDLGESFMVLDPKGQPHLANAALVAHQRRPAPAHVADAQPRDPNVTTVVQWNDSNVAESVLLPAHRKHGNPNTTRDTHAQDAERERRQQHAVKQEIENELNDPLVQSYLSTHAQSTMVRSQYDADNLTQSTISAFNKDTMENAKGVLNLLQTVRRIGEENTQLLMRIEHLTHLEERSARVYKDIDSFKQEFAEKFDDLKDLLTEHVYNMSELHKKANNARGSAENGAVAPSGGADGDVPLPLRDPLSSVILQEIRARKEAARTAAAKALTEAQDSKRASDVTPSEVGTVPVAMAAGNAGIAEKAVDQGGMSILRQQQLEKTIKNILARLEKSQLENKQKDALLEKYVRVINKMQQQRPKDESGEIEGLDLSSLTVASSSHQSSQPNAPPRDASSSNRDGVGGVVSTYRKPPSPSSGYHPSTTSASADVYGAPLSPGPVTRTSSGGVPVSAGLGSPTTAARKTLNLPPRNKLPPNATTAMEFLQKNVNK